jgi:hypothetical protein
MHGVSKSTDGGATWTAAPTNVPTSTLAFGQNVWVAGGNLALWSSPDGVAWTQHQVPNAYVGDVVFANNMFVAVGMRTILTSTDGITWTPRNVPTNGAIYRSVAWGGNMWVATGASAYDATKPVLASSPDGITWTERTPTPSRMDGLVFGGRRFVGVGIAPSLQGSVAFWAGGLMTSTLTSPPPVLPSGTLQPRLSR